MWAPLPKTSVGERISQQIRMLLIKKARSFHSKATRLGSPRSLFLARLSVPLAARGSPELVLHGFQSPPRLCTLCRTGNNSPKTKPMLSCNLGGISSPCKCFQAAIVRRSQRFTSQRLPTAGGTSVVNVHLHVHHLSRNGTSVALSLRSLGTLVYSSVLAGKQYSLFLRGRTEKTISNQARNKALAFQSVEEMFSSGSSPFSAAQGMLFAT